MKQLKMLLLSSMVVFFTACGGGGSTPEDTTAPIITVNGENPITITQDVSYTDEGAIAVDDKDGSVKVITTGTVDTSTIGTYTITYTATDNAGNVATAIRTVHVVISFLTLDNTFNSDGIVVYNNPVGGMLRDDDAGYAITLDNAGNIYVTGHSVNTDDYYDMVIWKYTSNGELDTTFGTGGIVVHNNAAGGYNDDMGYGIALDSAGNIYVTGYSTSNIAIIDMVIWKYTSNGELDTTFGTGGIVIADSNGSDEGIDITLDNIGNVYVTGHSHNNTTYNSDMVIWKYTSNGELDTTFGTGGIVVHNNAAGGNGNDVGRGIKLDSAGNVYVTGRSVNTLENYDMVIWKYTSNGELDTTFGTGGIVVHNNAAGGYNDDMGYGIALDSAGNVYVTGRSVNTLENSDMVIWKYTDEGTLDSIVVHSNAAGGGEYDSGIGIELDNIGNIFVTGVSINTDNYSDMVIWKYR